MVALSKITEELKDNSKVIATLGVVFVNHDTGEKMNTDPVFVSDKLLLTCGADV